MKFRARDYNAGEIAGALPRLPAADHPLRPSRISSDPRVSPEDGYAVFDDPLRGSTSHVPVQTKQGQDIDGVLEGKISSQAGKFLTTKEWKLLRSSLMLKPSSCHTMSISHASSVLPGVGKEGKSFKGSDLEELDNQEINVCGEKATVSLQDYHLRLEELKSEISWAWQADDLMKALKLSVKVSRLLMDTSVLEFYPTMFMLVVDVLDMVGNLVWERISKKAEYTEDGVFVGSVAENVAPKDVCSEARETCYNWFCKIGSISELIPRIYLELAILPCWRFLDDDLLPVLERLAMMMRGIADPLASAYCRLYMARCAATLHMTDVGFLIKSLNDLSSLLTKSIVHDNNNWLLLNKNKKVLLSLLEPAIQWIIKCMLGGDYQDSGNILVELGIAKSLSVSKTNHACPSIVFNCLLKEVPAQAVGINAVQIFDFMKENKDTSVQPYLNYRLVGLKLCESQHSLNSLCFVLDRVVQVLPEFKHLYEYLMIVDAYLDIILQCPVENYLPVIIEGIFKRAEIKQVAEMDFEPLRSIITKIINHYDFLEDALSLDHFIGLLEFLQGSSCSSVYMLILDKATRAHHISDPRTIRFLLEISQALTGSINVYDMHEDSKQKVKLVSRFVVMVDFGSERDLHLTFLTESRAAFGLVDELKCNLVHSANYLAFNSVKENMKFLSFLKSCIAFNEVTIPAIFSSVERMNLYIETAEVALYGGLVSHMEGLIASAINCLDCLDVSSDSHTSIDMNLVISLACKLCSMLVMTPDNEESFLHLPRKLMSTVKYQFLSSSVKVKICCAVIQLLASLYQENLPYDTAEGFEIASNYQLFFGHSSYFKELSSLSLLALEILDNVIKQELDLATRGSRGLEVCNCLLVSFEASDELILKCSTMIEDAKLYLPRENKYLLATINLFNKLKGNV